MSESQPNAQTITGRPFVTAILLAGGSGTRMRGYAEDKILMPIAGKPAIAHSIDAFLQSGIIDALVFVCRDEAQRAAIEGLLPRANISIVWARGGSERCHSVSAGLEAASERTEIALIHDCARPCVTPEAIRASVAGVQQTGAACLAAPVVDTIKSVRPTPDGYYHLQTVDRSRLWAMGTPQSFQYTRIRKAYRDTLADGTRITDDLAAIEQLGIPVAFIENGRPNPKLTTPEDVAYIEMILAKPFEPTSTTAPSVT